MTDGLHFAVVGGGMTGMYLSGLLAGQGRRVTLVEAESRLGGLAAEWEIDGFRAAMFYHVIVGSDSKHIALLDELKLSGAIRWAGPATGFYIDGALHSISGLKDFILFPPLSITDKAGLLYAAISAVLSSDTDRNGDERAVDWLLRVSGKKVTDRIWRPLLRAKFGNMHEQVSASYLKAILKRMAPAGGVSSRRGMLGYLEGGYTRAIDGLAQKLTALGGSIRTGAKVRSVERDRDGFTVHSDVGPPVRADRVIVTVPPPAVPDLCSGLTERERSTLVCIRYNAVVCPSLLINKDLGRSYVTNIADESVPFTGVINMTAIAPASTWGGRSLIYLPRYLSACDPLFSSPDQEIRSLFVPPLLKIFPEIKTEDIACFTVARSEYAFPVMTPELRRSLPQPSTSIPGLFLVSSAQIAEGTHNIDEAVSSAGKMLDIITEMDRE